MWSLADSEINLLTSKLSGEFENTINSLWRQLCNLCHTDLERDLDLERRKTRDLQETSRERDKEYQKLKVWGLSASVLLW